MRTNQPSRTRKSPLMAILASLFIGSVSAQASSTPWFDDETQTERIVLPEGYKYPNGITHSPKGRVFVGSVVSGDILEIKPNKKVRVAIPASEQVFAGTSLRFDEVTNILWVASPDFLGVTDSDGNVTRRAHRVAAIDVKKRKVLRIWTMPDQGFCNDIALDGHGGVFISDSIADLVHHIDSPTSELEPYATSSLFSPGELGPAGIVQLANSDLVVGLYSAGELLRVSGNDRSVSRIPLQRSLENPDGIYAINDNKILVLEGGASSGNGKLNLIDFNGDAPYAVHTLVEHIESPLNLTVVDDKVYITESRIRHLLIKDTGLPVPEAFFIREIDLSSNPFYEID